MSTAVDEETKRLVSEASSQKLTLSFKLKQSNILITDSLFNLIGKTRKSSRI